MKRIFIHPEKGVRGGFKIALILFLSLVFFTLLGFIFGNIALRVGDFNLEDLVLKPQAENIYFYVFLSLQHIGMFIATWYVLKFVDKSGFRAIGFTYPRPYLRDLLTGGLLGALSITLIFTFLFVFDQISIEGSLFRPNFTPHLLYGLYLFFLVGVVEEVFFRGYCMKKGLNYENVLIPVFGSSVIFTGMHLINPNLSFLGIFNIFLIGILFAYMFVKTGNLWMPIGFHIAWNYFQGNVFGLSVSGISIEGVYTITSIEDNIFTGGAFGLEGGILTTFVILLGFLVMKRYQQKNLKF